MNHKNIIVNLIIAILGVIAVIAIIAFVQLNVLNKEYTDIFGYSVFSTATGSMAPTIEIGDIVFVKIGNDDVKEQDIITYKKDGKFITHRIIKIDGESIITKGDNNNTADKEITKDVIVGKVVSIINNVEVWKSVFTDKSVIIPVAITIVLFIILVAYKEKSPKKDE